MALIIGHVADRRGSAQQEQHGGEEKEEPRRGAGEGEGAGVAVARGGEASQCGPPPLPRRGAAVLAEGAREFHRKRWMTHKRQSKG